MRLRLLQNPCNRGFTLIELIIVIVILSILAIVALPRFVDLEERAARAALRNTLGALQSAARISESAAIATNQSGNGIVIVNGASIGFLNGYPLARANDISPTGPGLFDGILRMIELEGGINVSYSDTTNIVSGTLASDDLLILELNGMCVTYRPPQVSGDLPEYSNGLLNYDSVANTCS